MADGLARAASPTFAIMALLSGVLGGGPAEMLCLATHASPLSGMVTMYLLMSVFHAGWRGRGLRRGVRGREVARRRLSALPRCPDGPRLRYGSSISARRQRVHGQTGFTTAAANPYAVIFFAALFPQFIDPAATLVPQIAVLGATYLVIDAAILLAMGASSARIIALLGDRFRFVVSRVSGLLMIAAALLLVMRDVSPGRTR